MHTNFSASVPYFFFLAFFGAVHESLVGTYAEKQIMQSWRWASRTDPE
jgi:hypothetical protein